MRWLEDLAQRNEGGLQAVEMGRDGAGVSLVQGNPVEQVANVVVRIAGFVAHAFFPEGIGSFKSDLGKSQAKLQFNFQRPYGDTVS